MTTDHGFRATLNVPYEEAIEKATAALQEEGFGVLTEIDGELPAPERLLASCFNEGHRTFILQLPLSDRRCHHDDGPSRGSHGRF